MKNLPSFIIIGSSKCGTTSLHAYLTMHPQIFLPGQKEVHFFLDEEVSWGTWKKGLKWYSDLFDGSEDFVMRGEASPAYAHDDQSLIASKKMYSVIPNTKLVFMVRDPIKRIQSQYLQEVFDGRLPPEILLDDIVSGGPCADGLCGHYYRVIVHSSLYARQLRRYLNYYNRDDVHIVIAEEFFSNTEGELTKLFAFLGVDCNYLPPNIGERLNVTSGKRLRFVNPTAILKKLPGYHSMSAIIPSELKEIYRKSISKNIDHDFTSKINDKNYALLSQMFAEDVADLEALSGQGFRTWPSVNTKYMENNRGK